jgi:hypothetical protein
VIETEQAYRCPANEDDRASISADESARNHGTDSYRHEGNILALVSGYDRRRSGFGRSVNFRIRRAESDGCRLHGRSFGCQLSRLLSLRSCGKHGKSTQAYSQRAHFNSPFEGGKSP